MQNIIIGLILLVSAGAVVVIVSPWEDQQPSQADIANESDPLTSLTSTDRSTRWGEQFWTAEAKAQSSLFAMAKHYCAQGEHKDSPNCKVVNVVAWLHAPREPVPEYGSRGGFGKMPSVGAGQ